jgi:hypothetical protein
MIIAIVVLQCVGDLLHLAFEEIMDATVRCNFATSPIILFSLVDNEFASFYSH